MKRLLLFQQTCEMDVKTCTSGSHVCTWVLHEDVCEWKPGAFVLCQKTGPLLRRQLGASRISLTSSAGALTSNTPLMADKLIGPRQAGQQMGTLTSEAAQQNLGVLLRPLHSKCRPAIFMRGNGLLLYGTPVKCQILPSSKLQLGLKKKKKRKGRLM